MSAIKFNVSLHDFHLAHRRRKHGRDSTATWLQFQQILQVMGDILGDELIAKGKVTFPMSTWKLRVYKKKKSAYVDKKASKEFNAKTYAFNDHSDGYACFICLETDERQNRKKRYYVFKTTRLLGREKLRDAIRQNKSVIYNYENSVNKDQ